MMKEKNVGPLLLLLLLGVTPRDSCANPIASPGGEASLSVPTVYGNTVFGNTGGAPTKMSRKIATDMITGAEILKNAMYWLQEHTLSSQFDDSINDLETKIIELPTDLAVERVGILEGLYKSRDELIFLRSILVKAATILKSNCKEMIEIYDGTDCTQRLLTYAAEKFVGFANGVNDILGAALNKTEEINNKLSAAKALLIDFQAKLEYKKKEIKAEKEAAVDIQQLQTNQVKQQKDIENMLNEDEQCTDRVAIIFCIFTSEITPGLDCTITIAITNTDMRAATTNAVADRRDLEKKIRLQEMRQNEIATKSKLLNAINPAHESAATLLSHVKDVKEYLIKEIILINNWKFDLNTAINDHIDISVEDLFFNIKGIKERLNILEKACDDYLAHVIPVSLQSNVS